MPDTENSALTRRRLLQHGMAIALGGLAVPELLRHASHAQSAAPAGETSTRSWTIGNALIARTLTCRSGGLYTEGFADLVTGAKLIAPDKPRSEMTNEFSFECNGRAYYGSSSEFELLGADESKVAGGRSLAVRLRHKELGLEVDAIYVSYDGHPAIRKHLVLRNIGASALKFTHLNIESLGLALGPENETILDTQYGAIPREIFYTGRSEDAGLLLANSLSGQGVAIVTEVPGYMKRTEIGGWEHDGEHVGVRAMYDTDLMPFERSVAPGREFKTASVSLAAFRRGGALHDPRHDPRWVLPSYAAKVLERRVDAQGPPWIYNTWEPFQRSINHDTALELIEVAGEMGIDVFTIDDGWQQEYGDNAVNLASFPGGLQPILDAVEAKGMRLGLWMPMAAIGTATAEYRAHPEWASRDIEGKTKLTWTMGGDKAVMCMATPFRDAAADRINDAIERFRLAYVKLDITTIFNAYGEAPGCWAKGHDHGSWAESLNMIYEGIAYTTAKVYAKHPDVLLDLTFELWGQKHIIDAGLLAAGDLDWMSNVDDTRPDSAGPIQARQLLYQRAISMPVEAMLIGNIHAELPTIQESFATAIGSAPLLLGDLRKLSASDRQWYGEKIGWFKKLRRRTKISESFFPLGSWRQTRSDQWDGFARLASSGDGVIALFRNKSEMTTATVQIPVMPPGKFKLRSAMTGKEIGVFAQDDFARGIAISLQERVEVVEVAAIG
jgi:alpha-galactosidase